MMRIREIEPTDDDRWRKLIDDCGGNALHLPAIHLAEQKLSELRLLAFAEDDIDVGCALAILPGKSGLRRFLGGSKVLSLPTAPALMSGASADSLRDTLLDYARAASFDRLVVSAGYSQNLNSDPVLERFRSATLAEFILTLGQDEEAIAAAYHKTHRKNVRRAARSGLVCREDSSFEGLLSLREMQLNSSKRASEKSDGFAVPDESFFERLHQHVYSPGIGHLLIAELEGKPVASLAWIVAGGRAQTVRSGSTREGYETRAMYFLYDELIRRCIREGLAELNCGAVHMAAAAPDHAEHGLYEFKAGFAATVCERHALDIPLSELER